MRLLAAVTASLCVVALTVAPRAARRGGPRRGAPAPAREGAPRSISPATGCRSISEDWKFRMVTPKKGVYDSLTLNAEGRRVGDTWDPAKDEAAGEQCRAYGAANIMRLPGRLHITWQDDNTLRIDTDAGTQTRLLRFGAAPAAGRTAELAGTVGRASGNTRPAARGAAADRQSEGRRRPTCVRATSARTARRTAPRPSSPSTSTSTRCRTATVVDRHDEGRGPGLLRPAVPDDDGFQEAARRGGVESRALLGTLTAAF